LGVQSSFSTVMVVQVENEELLYGTGTEHFAAFFSTSGILRHNVAGATDTPALDAIEQAIEQTRSGPAPAEPGLLITSPSSWSAPRRIKDDLHRYTSSPDPTREEANQLWGVLVLVTTQCNPGDGLLINTPPSSGKRSCAKDSWCARARTSMISAGT
jgi:hypothetical protein